MKREEAIKTLKELWRETNDQWYEETYAMAIEALSQESSEDVISRQAAIDAVCLNNFHDITLVNGKPYTRGYRDGVLEKENDCIENIMNLPSAQPERKKGRWIPVDSYSAFGGDEATWMAHGNPVAFYYCSECKEQAYAGEDGESLLTDYCPNCGADMRGEE